jgi:hypothetical protein
MVMMYGFLRLQSLSRPNEGLAEEFAKLIRRAATEEQLDCFQAHMPVPNHSGKDHEDGVFLPGRQTPHQTLDKIAPADRHRDEPPSEEGGCQPPCGQPIASK